MSKTALRESPFITREEMPSISWKMDEAHDIHCTTWFSDQQHRCPVDRCPPTLLVQTHLVGGRPVIGQQVEPADAIRSRAG